MTRRLPENLARLYASFGGETARPFALFDGESFVVDGVEFVCDYQPDSTPDRFFIVKPMAHVERYRALFERFIGANIVELGIAEGGSTALTALLAKPRKLVALDIEDEPLVALLEFVERRGLDASIRPIWGVDQGDGARLMQIVAEEFGGEPLDLVIDDASHQLALTRSSFEVLFPYLRPGGLFIVEDWNNDHVFYDAVGAALRDPSSPGHEEQMQAIKEAMRNPEASPARSHEPLSRLAIELLLVRASSGAAVAEVTLGEYSIVVQRGPAELDPATFRIRDQYVDHFGLDPGRPPG